MKKIVFFLSLVLLITGCNIQNLKSEDIDTIIDKALSKEVNLINVNFEGYKLYIPRGASIVDKRDYNIKVNYKEENYYLYIDVISYYHSTENEYEENNKIYYSKKLNYDEKFGYIEITEVDDKYFIEMVYNYTKVEAYVSEENLNEAIVNACYMLTTVTFNDEILETLIGENVLNYQEEQFDMFDSKRESGNFLDYLTDLDTYITKEEKETKDEDFVQTVEE